MRKFLILICLFTVCFFCAFFIKSKSVVTPQPQVIGHQPEQYALQDAPVEGVDKLALLQRIDEERTALISRIIPSVVCISTEGVIRETKGDVMGPEQVVKDIGSGVIISHEGHIITNNHVVAGKEKFTVALQNKKSFNARVVGVDPKLDIAVLKIEAGDLELQPLKFGDSDEVRVGQQVFAVGNPFGLGATVTQGIISAKERSFSDDQRDLFQTDAAINPGNSGGPLINVRGEVIGINVAIYSSNAGQPTSQGVGFSLPSNEVLQSFRQIAEKGRPISGYLGIKVRDLSPELKSFLKYDGTGVAVNAVTKGSPAESAGLLPNDVIHKYGKKKVVSFRQLIHLIQTSPTDKEITLEVIRDGEPLQLNATVMDIMSWEGAQEMIYGKEMSKIMARIASIGMRVRDLEWIEARRGDVGVVISEVGTPSLATRIGLRAGDRVISLNGKRLESAEQFYRDLIDAQAGDEIVMILQRHNRVRSIKFTLV